MAMTRDEALAKVKKLLAMAQDGRGNEHEAEAAMRQANAIMRKYELDNMDEIMKDLEQGLDMIQECDPVSAYKTTGRHKTCPAWVGVVAVGVAEFTDTKVDTVNTLLGVMVRFSGYAPDVQFGRWLYRYLIESIYKYSEQHAEGRGGRADYRYGMACAVQARLYAMHAANKVAGQQASDGRALMLVDAKKQAVEQAFGEQQVKATQGRVTEARINGARHGHDMSIPTNRPLSGHSSGQARLS